MQQTSKDAYESVFSTLGARQKTVYEALEKIGPATNRELAEYLGWEINRITPRMNELVERKQVHMYERRRCTITGFTAMAWEINRPTLF